MQHLVLVEYSAGPIPFFSEIKVGAVNGYIRTFECVSLFILDRCAPPINVIPSYRIISWAVSGVQTL